MAKKRYYLLANPEGGAKNVIGIINEIKPVFEAAGAELMIHETSWSRHASEITRDMDFDNYDGLCTVGGDGTVHETINGLLKRRDGKKIPLGLIPGGSGNSFLWGLGCHNPIDAAQRILKGETGLIDVAEMTMGDEILYSFNIIGWGLVTAINHTSEKFRWWPKQRYNLATVIELIRLKARATKLIVDGKEIDGKVAFLIACNTPYTGVGMKMAPKASLNDGKIDLIVVNDATRMQMLKLFPKVFDGSHIESDLVDYYQAETFELIPEINDLLDVDGELTGTTPFKVKMIPQAVEIFM
ncbi:MAG: diacylglycerol kinase family protein [Candidatus Neomarinimicrobiota bacterium]